MQTRRLLLLGGLSLGVALVFGLFPRFLDAISEPSAEPSERQRPSSAIEAKAEPPKTPKSRADAPRAAQKRTPEAKPEEKPSVEADPHKSKPHYATYAPPGDDMNPAAGLSFETLSDADRERLKVPKGYGRGLRITDIHPDAPAAEAGLEIDDVIVRAERVNIDGDVETLREATGSVLHPRILISRHGTLIPVVLDPPYRP